MAQRRLLTPSQWNLMLGWFRRTKKNWGLKTLPTKDPSSFLQIILYLSNFIWEWEQIGQERGAKINTLYLQRKDRVRNSKENKTILQIRRQYRESLLVYFTSSKHIPYFISCLWRISFFSNPFVPITLSNLEEITGYKRKHDIKQHNFTRYYENPTKHNRGENTNHTPVISLGWTIFQTK